MLIKKPRFWDSKNFSIWPIILYPVSIIYLFVVNLISKLNKKQIFEIPIICVGNIYLGGTGKTPLAAEIFKFLKPNGKKPSFIKKQYDYLFDEIKMLKNNNGEISYEPVKIKSFVHEKIFLDLQSDEIEFANKEFKILYKKLIKLGQHLGLLALHAAKQLMIASRFPQHAPR